MADSYKFPGVYASITDLSGVVATNATTACAYVGEAEYGPVFEPTLLSTLQDYTNRFGTLSSQYGYAGYSLAVAAETISEHQFVRVAPVGDPSAHDEQKDSKWAACAVAVKGKEAKQEPAKGYWYEEVTAAKSSSESTGDSGLFQEDTDDAFIVIATDPNNRKFYITTADSTINENKAYPVTQATTFEEGADTHEGEVKVTVTVNGAIAADLEEGCSITVTKMSNADLNGVFPVDSYEIVNNEDGKTVKEVKIVYYVKTETQETTDSAARVGRYPDANETTFSFSIAEKVGRVMQVLESYDYCTLYPAKDAYGNSTYIEDVVNGTSNYVQVFVNQSFREEDVNAAPIPASVTALELTGGQAGTYKGREDTKYTDLNKAWDLFKDRSQVNVTLLMNSGYVSRGNVSYQSKMLEIAEHRRDCFCLFDVPMTDTDFELVQDWRKNIQGFNSYRGAISSPWVKTYDSVQGRANFLMCPSAFVAKIMGSAQPWVAPAGLNRGVLSASVVSPTGLSQYYDETQGGVLYTDNQINCIIKNPGAGYVNWGQRTLQPKPSALDRINVARTVIYIETVLRDAAKWHVFENNTPYERTQISLQFSSFLNTVLTAEGIQRFQVICDESNNPPQVIANNQLVIDIYLWPTYVAEIIKITSTIMGADTTVSITTI